MMFAKALCVVLLLYSASFGDSRSLKNGTDSEKRTVYLPPAPQVEQNANDLVLRTKKMIQNVKPYAEVYRGFLLFLLREIWRNTAGFCDGPYDVDLVVNAWDPNNNANKDSPLNNNGLYFLFISVNDDIPDDVQKQGGIYPFYVGITERSFIQRFTEHVKQGKVKKLNNDLQTLAYVVKMPLTVAKFFESVFLSSFDFASNIQENGLVRKPNLKVKQSQLPMDGYLHFKKTYDIAIEELNKKKLQLPEDVMKIWEPQLKYYDFNNY